MSFFTKIFLGLFATCAILVGAFYYQGYQKDKKPVSKIEDNLVLENKNQNDSEIELKEKIGQMIMVGFRGTQFSPDSDIAKAIDNQKIGGVILFDYDVFLKSPSRNIVSPKQVKKLIADLQKRSKTPLLVGVDAEGGKVNRLKKENGFSTISSAAFMGRDATLKTTKKESTVLAEELSQLGFNIDFAPVVDVNINPKNPIIGALDRSFSSDPEKVFLHAREFMKNLISYHIIPVVKHFPGHGSSTADSHLGLVDVTKTYQAKELEPYARLQKEGLLDVVMTAHIVNQNIDKDYPATLSHKFLQNILRQQIGFEGVIISDDLQMGAIAENYSFKETINRAINAGCDILLIPNNAKTPYDAQIAEKTVETIYQLIQEGKIDREKIEKSYKRVRDLKVKFGIIS
jgi:beta-N-acetylhexosaminidase